MLKNLVELESEHPGFNDPAYRKRRDEIATAAMEHVAGTPAPRVAYTALEVATWGTIFDRLTSLYPSHACAEYNQVIGAIGYRRDALPQIAEVSAFLERRTGFQLQPVAGLVAPRDFLEALSRRVFCATQYLRHHSRPFYTPEPDVVHELMGHAPMLAIPAFADLSQKIGEGSLGADERRIGHLATLYWFTIEYGILATDAGLRAYGAGLLSSFGELEHAVAGKAEVRPLDPEVAKDTLYPITSYQPLLWSVRSIDEAFARIAAFVTAG